MRRYIFYCAAGFLTFLVSIFALVSYDLWKVNKSESEGFEQVKRSKMFLKNEGFGEILAAGEGRYVTVQGFIDEKFLCHDVVASQANFCTTALIGNSLESKSVGIHLRVCNEQTKNNCIVWAPDNSCAANKLCSDEIKIYDNDSNLIDLKKQNSFSAKVSSAYGEFFLDEPVERIERPVIR